MLFLLGMSFLFTFVVLLLWCLLLMDTIQLDKTLLLLLVECFVLFCFKSNAVRKPERPMQDKRKDQILSSWTEPPFEAPQVHLPPILVECEMVIVMSSKRVK
jgi:hypothetical protein